MSNAILTFSPTFNVPVIAYAKDGTGKVKSVNFAIDTVIGGSHLIEFVCRDFTKNGKVKPFFEITVDQKFNVIISTFEVANTKGYDSLDGSEISNLSELVASFVFDNLVKIEKNIVNNGNVDKKSVLMFSLFGLFYFEIGDLDLSKPFTKKIKQLTADQVFAKWSELTVDDQVIQKIVEYSKSQLKSKSQAK